MCESPRWICSRQETATSVMGKYNLHAAKSQKIMDHEFKRRIDKSRFSFTNTLYINIPISSIANIVTNVVSTHVSLPRSPKPKAGRFCINIPPWKTIMVPNCSLLQTMPSKLDKMQTITCAAALESLTSEGSSHHGSLGNNPHRNSSWTEGRKN